MPALATLVRRRPLALLFAAALVLRVGAVGLLPPPAGRPSTYEHGAIAENLLAGRGFSVWFLGTEGPTSQQAPWVPLVLSGCYALLGAGSNGAILTYQLLQCAAGAALVVCVVRWAWNLFPERPAIGWCAGAAAALYPPHVYMCTHVQAATWGALGVGGLFALVSAREPGASPRRAAAAGVVAGWLLWIDPILALPTVGAMLELYRSAQRTSAGSQTFGLRRSLPAARCVGLAGLCAAAVAAPWIVRNYAVHGEFVLIKSTFGYAFWQGNNPASRGTDKIPKPEAAALAAAHDGSPADRHRALWEARHETLYIDDMLLKPGGYREFAGLSEPERSRRLGSRAWDFIVEHPADYARLCLRRLQYFLLWDETNPKAANPIYQAASTAWLVLSLVGLMAAGRARRTLAPSVAALLLTTLFHALTITSARFRIPVEACGFLWASAGFMPALANIAGYLRGARRATPEPEAAANSPESTTRRGPAVGPHFGTRTSKRSRTGRPR